MNNTLSVYCILGIKGSGRKMIVRDLLESLQPDDLPAAVITSPTESAEFANDLPDLPITPWNLDAFEPTPLSFEYPQDSKTLFIISDGLDSPIHLLESLALWCQQNDFPNLIITTVVHCNLCATHHPVHSWHQAAIHFSDFVLLNQRDAVDNKWLADFQKPFQRQFYPCVFELIRNGHIKNPAVILNSPPRRMSQAFEENQRGYPADVEIEGDEEDENDSEDSPLPEHHFERLLNKHYRRPVPNLTQIIQ